MLNKSSSKNISRRFSATSRPMQRAGWHAAVFALPGQPGRKAGQQAALLHWFSKWIGLEVLSLRAPRVQAPAATVPGFLPFLSPPPPPSPILKLFYSFNACLVTWARHWRLDDGDVELTETLLLSGDSLNHVHVLPCLEVEVGVLVNVFLADGVESMAHWFFWRHDVNLHRLTHSCLLEWLSFCHNIFIDAIFIPCN